MSKRTCWSVLSALCFLVCALAFAQEPSPAEEETAVRAYFLGYDNDDLIFRIVNDGASSVSINGLSFNHQILYRPVEKDIVVPVSVENIPFKDMTFRSTGDFVWSENHMGKFQLAYQEPDSEDRMFGRIYPKLSPLVLEKELVTETVP